MIARQVARRVQLASVAALVCIPAKTFAGSSYVRPSTESESRYRLGDLGAFGSVPCELGDGAGCQGRWFAEDALWQTGFSPEPQHLFDIEDEITIVSSIINYARTELSLEFLNNGSQLQLNAIGATTGIQPLNFRFPEDLPKELLLPIGPLPAGSYELTIANTVDIEPAGMPPQGLTRQTKEDVLRFTVVPEAATLGLLATALLPCGRCRRRKEAPADY